MFIGGPTSSSINIQDRTASWQKTFEASLFFLDFAFKNLLSEQIIGFSEEISAIKRSDEYQFRMGFFIAGVVDASSQIWDLNPDEGMDVFAAVYMAFLIKILGRTQIAAEEFGSEIAAQFPPQQGTPAYEYMISGGDAFTEFNAQKNANAPFRCFIVCEVGRERIYRRGIN